MRVELVREGAVISLPAALWEDIQELAREHGWHPSRAGRRSFGAGARMRGADARAMAEALVGAINSAGMPPRPEAELSRLVALVNYLRNGDFVIR
jgi:hypothetical protein